MYFFIVRNWALTTDILVLFDHSLKINIGMVSHIGEVIFYNLISTYLLKKITLLDFSHFENSSPNNFNEHIPCRLFQGMSESSRLDLDEYIKQYIHRETHNKLL